MIYENWFIWRTKSHKLKTHIKMTENLWPERKRDGQLPEKETQKVSSHTSRWWKKKRNKKTVALASEVKKQHWQNNSTRSDSTVLLNVVADAISLAHIFIEYFLRIECGYYCVICAHAIYLGKKARVFSHCWYCCQCRYCCFGSLSLSLSFSFAWYNSAVC